MCFLLFVDFCYSMTRQHKNLLIFVFIPLGLFPDFIHNFSVIKIFSTSISFTFKAFFPNEKPHIIEERSRINQNILLYSILFQILPLCFYRMLYDSHLNQTKNLAQRSKPKGFSCEKDRLSSSFLLQFPLFAFQFFWKKFFIQNFPYEKRFCFMKKINQQSIDLENHSFSIVSKERVFICIFSLNFV